MPVRRRAPEVRAEDPKRTAQSQKCLDLGLDSLDEHRKVFAPRAVDHGAPSRELARERSLRGGVRWSWKEEGERTEMQRERKGEEAQDDRTRSKRE
eukprot:3374349-Rhodomonas_salina.1